MCLGVEVIQLPPKEERQIVCAQVILAIVLELRIMAEAVVEETTVTHVGYLMGIAHNYLITIHVKGSDCS